MKYFITYNLFNQVWDCHARFAPPPDGGRVAITSIIGVSVRKVVEKEIENDREISLEKLKEFRGD